VHADFLFHRLLLVLLFEQSVQALDGLHQVGHAGMVTGNRRFLFTLFFLSLPAKSINWLSRLELPTFFSLALSCLFSCVSRLGANKNSFFLITSTLRVFRISMVSFTRFVFAFSSYSFFDVSWLPLTKSYSPVFTSIAKRVFRAS